MMTEKIDEALTRVVEDAFLATCEEAGALPDRIEDMPAYMRQQARRIRAHDRRLMALDERRSSR